MDDKHPQEGPAGGYRFMTPRHELACYWPILNQVWIKPGLSTDQKQLVKYHERHHHAMALFEPADPLPLKKFLLGEDHREEIQKFEDVVETLYVILLPLLADLPAHPNHFLPARKGVRHVK